MFARGSFLRKVSHIKMCSGQRELCRELHLTATYSSDVTQRFLVPSLSATRNYLKKTRSKFLLEAVRITSCVALLNMKWISMECNLIQFSSRNAVIHISKYSFNLLDIILLLSVPRQYRPCSSDCQFRTDCYQLNF